MLGKNTASITSPNPKPTAAMIANNKNLFIALSPAQRSAKSAKNVKEFVSDLPHS
jgi:hypothetical protein